MIRETNAQRLRPAQLGMNVISFPNYPTPPNTWLFKDLVIETDALILFVQETSRIAVKELRATARKQLGLDPQ